MQDVNKWHEIGDKLTAYLGICSCQRKLKSFIDILVRIWENGNSRKVLLGEEQRPWTGEEYMILAFLDNRNLICHGTNCEYPIIVDNEFWQWVLSVKDSPYLEDN
jgi:hypothetical protein